MKLWVISHFLYGFACSFRDAVCLRHFDVFGSVGICC